MNTTHKRSDYLTGKRVKLETKEEFDTSLLCDKISEYAKERKIGQGASATVFLRCNVNNLCKYVIRIQGPSFGDMCDEEEFENTESSMTRTNRLADAGLAPRIIAVKHCNDTCLTLMEYVRGTTLSEMIDQHLPINYDLLFETIEKMQAILPQGHGDMHGSNIIWNNERQKWMFIDITGRIEGDDAYNDYINLGSEDDIQILERVIVELQNIAFFKPKLKHELGYEIRAIRQRIKDLT